MADLEEGFELCKIPSGAEVFGVEKHCEEDFVILTLRNREVLVYNIADRKIVKSWSLEPKQELSCPAVQDISSKKYYIVRNEKQLLAWHDSASDLREARIIQLPKAAKRIYCCSSKIVCHEPLIIFKDNSVVPVSTVGKEAKQKSQQPNQRLLWCATHKSNDEKHWFSRILTNQNSSKVQLVMQFIKSSLTNHKYVYTINNPITDGKLFCWSIISNYNEEPVFVSLWSDGCLYKTGVPIVNKLDKDNESKKTLLHCEFVAKLTTDTCQVPCYFLSNVVSTFVCVATTSLSCTGVPTQMQDAISLWDVKFGTLHSQKTVSDIVKTPDDPPRGINHLLCTASFIITTNNCCVTVCSYRAVKSTLKSSLGTLHDQQSKGNNIKPMFLGTPMLIKPDQTIEEWTDSIVKEDETEDKLLQRLLKQTMTSEQLVTELENYYKVKMNDQDQSEADLKEPSKQQQKKTAAKAAIVSQYFVTCLFQRCVQERNLWCHDLGQFLIRTTSIPQRFFGQFLGIILENNDMILLRESFQKLNGIPETSVVNCLKYILRMADSEFISSSDKEWTHAPCCLSKARYLCIFLAYPFNDVFLQESLKRLSFEETLMFIQFLLHVVKNWKYSLKELLSPPDVKDSLTYTQILNWTGLILNAHFTRLIIFPEAQKLLVNLHEAVSEQIVTHESFEQLEGYLCHFKNQKPLPRQDYLGAYTVESMQL